MSKPSSLADKYKPTRVDELAWPPPFRKRLQHIIDARAGSMILAGQPGLGKTLAIDVMRALDPRADVAVQDCSKKGSIEDIKAFISDSYSMSMFGDRRVMVLDEADSASPQAIMSMRGDTMTNGHTQWILITNNLDKLHAAVRSRCEVFDFNAPEHRESLKQAQLSRAQEILRAEGISIAPGDLADRLSSALPDFRQVLRELEVIVAEARAATIAEPISLAPNPDEAETDHALMLVSLLPEPVDHELGALRPVTETAALLADIVAILNRHLVLPTGAAEAIALFVLLAYTHDAADFSPILALTSPQKECGKTTVLDILLALIENAILSVDLTGAALFERADEGHALLIDEADTFLKTSSDLVRLLNGGVTRNSAVHRAYGRSFKVWCPKVVARIGPIEPEPLASRCIIIPMKRRAPNETRERVRPQLRETSAGLRERCREWADDNMELLQSADPSMPDGFENRRGDRWRALFAIADLAGAEWGAEARKAATALEQPNSDEEVGVLVLEAIQAAFIDSGDAVMFSAELVEFFRSRHDHIVVPRGPIARQWLASILRPYSIRPKNIRRSGKQAKGYDRLQFEDAFSRYLSRSVSDSPPGTAGTAGTAILDQKVT